MWNFYGDDAKHVIQKKKNVGQECNQIICGSLRVTDSKRGREEKGEGERWKTEDRRGKKEEGEAGPQSFKAK